MKPMRVARIAGVVLISAVLSACGSQESNFGNVIGAVRETIQAGRADDTPSGLDTGAVAAALAATDKPLALMQSEEPVRQFIMVDIARNGPYRTYATSTREAVILRGGMITSTRGLGGDLMSTDEDQLLSLIGSRLSGSAVYKMRHLTPEDVTVETSYRCSVTRGERTPVQIGEINSSGLVMKADCQSDGGDIVNTFVVDDNGQILTARQFISDYFGYLIAQTVRR